MSSAELLETKILLRPPRPEQAIHLHHLVAECPPLDGNSVYCNLLQCSHFADTSVAALADGVLVGFISGYLVPGRPDSLFIWQVAVGDKARGRGLASAMLLDILERPACRAVRFLETSVTPDNRASWALFRGLADKLGADIDESVLFDKQRHFGGAHDSEMLCRIGPFRRGPGRKHGRQQSHTESGK